VDQLKKKGAPARCSPWFSGGGPKCGNDSGFPAVGGGQDAKGGNRGVPQGPIE
jgi:hypothetical protein